MARYFFALMLGVAILVAMPARAQMDQEDTAAYDPNNYGYDYDSKASSSIAPYVQASPSVTTSTATGSTSGCQYEKQALLREAQKSIANGNKVLDESIKCTNDGAAQKTATDNQKTAGFTKQEKGEQEGFVRSAGAKAPAAVAVLQSSGGGGSGSVDSLFGDVLGGSIFSGAGGIDFSNLANLGSNISVDGLTSMAGKVAETGGALATDVRIKASAAMAPDVYVDP